jgi:CxxC motif-containing protein
MAQIKEQTVTCIICPLGCEIKVAGEDGGIRSVEGFQCKRGEEYARNEFTHPLRVLTSTVAVSGSDAPLVPVRSTKGIPRELIFDCMSEIKKASVTAPISRYDVVIRDILGTGVDIVTTGAAR